MQPDENLRELILKGARKLGVSIPPDAVSKLLIYLKVLKRWNAKVNLTAIQNEREIIIRHFLDSLAGLAALPPEKRVAPLRALDVGTGAGFPGLPIKICRPEIQLTLLEPRQKKVAFLHTVCGLLGLVKVHILAQRIEKVVQQAQHQKTYDLVLSRALKPSLYLEKIPLLLRPGGRFVLWTARGRKEVLGEINQLSGWDRPEEIHYRLPFEEINRSLVVLTRTD